MGILEELQTHIKLLWGQFGISHTSVPSKDSQRLKFRDDAEVTKMFSGATLLIKAMQGFPLLAMGWCEVEGTEVLMKLFLSQRRWMMEAAQAQLTPVDE